MKSLLLIASTLLVISCKITDDQADNHKQNTSLSYAASTIVQTGMIDQPIRRLIRYYNSSTGDHLTDYRVMDYTGSGYQREGLMWYIMSPVANTGATTTPLYELWENNTGDHMTSTSWTEGSYSHWIQLGNIFTSANSDMGLQPILRKYQTFTYGDRIDHWDATYLEPTPSGAFTDGAVGYGWPAAQYVSAIDYVSKSGTGIQIGSSRNWGGAIVSLIKNGTEYINRFDAGRLLQAAMWYGPEAVYHDNPTEGGDAFKNGSPVLNYNTSPATGQMSSSTLALQWCQGRTDCSEQTPIISGTTISKDVAIQTKNRIKFKTSYIHSKITDNLPDAGSNWWNNGRYANHEPLTAYLNNGLFDQIDVYNWDGSSWGITASASAIGSDGGSSYSWINHSNNNPTYIMARKSDYSNALALFFKNPIIHQSAFGWYRGQTNVSGGGPLANQTLKINILTFINGMTPGSTYTYDGIYVLLGTTTEIRRQADSLRVGQVY